MEIGSHEFDVGYHAIEQRNVLLHEWAGLQHSQQQVVEIHAKLLEGRVCSGGGTLGG